MEMTARYRGLPSSYWFLGCRSSSIRIPAKASSLCDPGPEIPRPSTLCSHKPSFWTPGWCYLIKSQCDPHSLNMGPCCFPESAGEISSATRYSKIGTSREAENAQRSDTEKGSAVSGVARRVVTTT
ncbi:hypothetical protein TPAR_01455 [Tolypocladium paradoxum]|uniref:Uncharacterized protein n=1 Tax=Tolypocladium paradoxum TaxID=94208 RepID=A0A2S4L7E1_9HYPO|nr:hypothetical protein TPAR_01455 [Tolypocladium paradoxum]